MQCLTIPQYSTPPSKPCYRPRTTKIACGFSSRQRAYAKGGFMGALSDVAVLDMSRIRLTRVQRSSSAHQSVNTLFPIHNLQPVCKRVLRTASATPLNCLIFKRRPSAYRFREDDRDVSPASVLFIPSLLGIVRPRLLPVGSGQAGARQNVGSVFGHQP